MIPTCFKLAYRSLINKKHNSVISIMGLGIGLATVLLVGAYFVNEYSFDKFQQNYQRIYRIVNKTGNTAKLDKEFTNSIADNLPGIESVCRLNIFYAMLGNESNPVNINNLVISDSSFFKLFSFKLLVGSISDVLNGPNKIVLSESLAEKLFPNTSGVGKQVRVNMKEYCTVTGIMKDSPVNSSIRPDAVVSLYTKDLPYTGGDYWNNNGNFHVELFQYYLLLHNEKDTVQTLKFLHSTYSEKWRNDKPDLALQPYSRLHSEAGIEETGGMMHTNKKLLLLLLSIGFVVLLLAIINTFNILLSESFEETKQACILKSTGASGSQIVWQGLSTITMTLFLALVLAVIIIDSILPWFSKEVERQINLQTFVSLPFLLFVIATLVVLTLVIGLYPSLRFAKSNPIDLLRKNGYGNFSIAGTSRATLVFQFVATITLIVAVLTIAKETKFVRHHQLGYKPDYLLFISVHYTKSKQTPILKQEFLKNPSILQVTSSFGAPGNIYSTSENKVNEKFMSYWEINSDEDFFSTFGISLKDGRFFLPGEKNRACIVNEMFYKKAEFKDLASATVREIPVVGVVKDFNTESLHNQITPGAVFFSTEDLTCLTLRISSSNIDQTLEYIHKVWKNICPEITLNYSFYDDMIEQQYIQEKRLTGTIGASSGIAIFISCLGLYSMILFVTKHRTKEIGIRKINGAKVSEVILMLIYDFLKWIVLAFIIACPISYYAMHRWLQNFAFKTEMNWWIFALAGIAALTFSLLTVIWQSWRAATRNPVEALRYE
jgi:putative ABC transport system permease protein